MFTRQPGSHNVLPLVSFYGGHGLTVVDDWAVHRLFNRLSRLCCDAIWAHASTRKDRGLFGKL